MSEQLVNTVQNEPILVESIEDFKGLKNNQKIIEICKQCGTKQTFNFRKCNIPTLSLFLCTNCKKERTSLLHYGVKNPAQSQQVKDKMKSTCLNKYGVEYAGASEVHKTKLSETLANKTPQEKQEISNKVKATKKARYGNENYNNLDKAKATNIQRYGTEIASQSQEIKDKTKNYFIKTFGCENPGQNDNIKEKIRQTCKIKYGTDSWIASEEGKEKISNAIISKYGTTLLRVYRYKYNDIIFDSSWELCFYLYHKDNNFDITRVKEPLEYMYEGNKHRYYPDFKVNGILYELKGSHFWKKDGTMQNPYNHKLDGLFEAKHQCGIRNNVVFIGAKEIKPYIKYVIDTYGKDFISSCLRKI